MNRIHKNDEEIWSYKEHKGRFMNNKGKIGVIPVIVVLISLVAAFLLFTKLNPEGFIKEQGAVVNQADIPANDKGASTGKTAGEDIHKLTGSEEFLDISDTEYVSAVPKQVIRTGIYGLKPWLDPYEVNKSRRNRSGRKAAEATDSFIVAASNYLEYYLIKLPDDSYILAQFSDTYRKSIEKGETVTLPLGIKKTNRKLTKDYLSDICSQYGASPDYVLYAIDTEWNKEHNFTVFIIRFGISAVVFLILAVALLTAAEKVFKRK